ncbi:nucleotidyltransferase family protein [Candidatus Bipolaricaulota sp. J31]
MSENKTSPFADFPSPITHHPSPITAVVLAAGAGQRMGTQKLLLPFRGKRLLAWVLELVESLPLERRLLVLGAHADAILSTFFTRYPSPVTHHGYLWEVLINRDWEEGLGSSLRHAARHVEGGMLVFLGDMPLVPREAAFEVLARARERPVAPVYRGRRGFPVYLPPGLRPRLLELRGDAGARELIKGDCELIPVDDPGVVVDIDDEGSLAAAVVKQCSHHRAHFETEREAPSHTRYDPADL